MKRVRKGAHTVLSADLRLWDDQLRRVAVVGASERVVQDTDGLQEVAHHSNFPLEVRRIGENLFRPGGELHPLTLIASFLHGGLDPDGFISVVEDLVNVRIQHVRPTVDGRETGKSLRELSQTVQRVDVR